MVRYVKCSIAACVFVGLGLVSPALAQSASEMAVRLQLLEEQVRQTCRSIMAEVRGRSEVEFVGELVAQLPTRVIGKLFGLPRGDWEFLRKLAEDMGVPYKVAGAAADEIGVRVHNCDLGCF